MGLLLFNNAIHAIKTIVVGIYYRRIVVELRNRKDARKSLIIKSNDK